MNPTLSLPACPEIIDGVVDMQNDFVTGALGTPEAAAIADAVAQAVRGALDGARGETDGLVMRSCHLVDSEEGWQDDAYVQQLVFNVKI